MLLEMCFVLKLIYIYIKSNSLTIILKKKKKIAKTSIKMHFKVHLLIWHYYKV